MAFNVQAALKAGYSQSEIDQYLKSDQLKADMNTLSQSKNNASLVAPLPQKSFTENIGGGIIDFLKGIANPFVRTGQNIAGAAIEAPAALASNAMAQVGANQQIPEKLRNLLMGGSKNLQKVNILGDEKRQQISQDPTKFLTQQAKDSANVASYGVPFGKGSNLLTKYLLPGAAVGGLMGVGKENLSTNSLVGDVVLGGATAGILGKGGELLNKVLSKSSGAVEKAGDAIRGSTRKITVRPSVYGAGEEKAIDAVLNKRGFVGTAQKQYENLAPSLNKMESEIQSVIKKNPDISINRSDIQASFIDNLKSSLRSKDLTQKQAITETVGYLNDLYRASGGKGNFTTLDLGKLRELKKLVNTDYGPIDDIISRGGALSPRQKVIQAAWSSLDDAVKTASPEIKALLKEESALYKAAPSLARNRFNPPTQRIMGTSIPGEVTQKGADVLGRTMQFLGGKGKELSNKIQLPSSFTNQAAVRAVLEMGNYPQKTQDQGYDQGIQKKPSSQFNQITPPDISVPQEQGGFQITPEILQAARLELSEKNYAKLKDIYELQNPKQEKKTEAEVAREQTQQLISDALEQIQLNPDIKTGMIGGPFEDLKAKVGMGDQPTLDFNATISNLAATIAKARGGTSFTPSEQRMLERYTPKVGDSQQELFTKLIKLKQLQAK